MGYVTRKQRKEIRKKKLFRFLFMVTGIILLGLTAVWGTKLFLGKETASGLELPEYSGQPYAEINHNIPFFEEKEWKTEPFESYSDLDFLGRCGTAYACVSKELMPTEERGEIGMIKPTGWHTVKYPEVIDDLYLYNRCHLIAWCLTGENANEKNLITGTRSMNINGMLPFEEMVADYVDKTGNHVMYRVTPIYERNNLIASGVLMEAYSVEDGGEGICFCVYCFNVQPGVEINYLNGESRLDGLAEE